MLLAPVCESLSDLLYVKVHGITHCSGYVELTSILIVFALYAGIGILLFNSENKG
jgi:hypothetical protein